MNKYVNGKLFIFACVVTLLWTIGCGCSKYNFQNVFILNDDLWARAQNISDADAFVIRLQHSEFERIKLMLVKQGFIDWQPLYRIYSGKFILVNNHGDDSSVPIFSRNYTTKLQGVFPVVIYYPDENLLYLVIADMIGG